MSSRPAASNSSNSRNNAAPKSELPPRDVSALRSSSSSSTSSGEKWSRVGGDRDNRGNRDRDNRGDDRDRGGDRNNGGGRRYNTGGNNDRRGDGYYRSNNSSSNSSSSAAQRPDPVIIVSPTAGAMPSAARAAAGILSPTGTSGLRFAHEASVGVYTKEQLLALCLPSYTRPTDLADVPGVTTDRFYAPVNLQTPSPEESAARNSGNWVLSGRSFVASGRGARAPNAGGNARTPRGEDDGDVQSPSGGDDRNDRGNWQPTGGNRPWSRDPKTSPNDANNNNTGRTDRRDDRNNDRTNDRGSSSTGGARGWRPADKGTTPTSAGTTPIAAGSAATTPKVAGVTQSLETARVRGGISFASALGGSGAPGASPTNGSSPAASAPAPASTPAPSVGVPPKRFLPIVTAGNAHLPRWFYKDPKGKIQGGFSDVEMKGWYEEGFFSFDLEVQVDVVNQPGSADRLPPFLALGKWFVEGHRAFLDYVPDITEYQRTLASEPQRDDEDLDQLHATATALVTGLEPEHDPIVRDQFAKLHQQLGQQQAAQQHHEHQQWAAAQRGLAPQPTGYYNGPQFAPQHQHGGGVWPAGPASHGLPPWAQQQQQQGGHAHGPAYGYPPQADPRFGGYGAPQAYGAPLQHPGYRPFDGYAPQQQIQPPPQEQSPEPIESEQQQVIEPEQQPVAVDEEEVASGEPSAPSTPTNRGTGTGGLSIPSPALTPLPAPFPQSGLPSPLPGRRELQTKPNLAAAPKTVEKQGDNKRGKRGSKGKDAAPAKAAAKTASVAGKESFQSPLLSPARAIAEPVDTPVGAPSLRPHGPPQPLPAPTPLTAVPVIAPWAAKGAKKGPTMAEIQAQERQKEEAESRARSLLEKMDEELGGSADSRRGVWGAAVNPVAAAGVAPRRFADLQAEAAAQERGGPAGFASVAAGQPAWRSPVAGAVEPAVSPASAAPSNKKASKKDLSVTNNKKANGEEKSDWEREYEEKTKVAARHAAQLTGPPAALPTAPAPVKQAAVAPTKKVEAPRETREERAAREKRDREANAAAAAALLERQKAETVARSKQQAARVWGSSAVPQALDMRTLMEQDAHKAQQQAAAVPVATATGAWAVQSARPLTGPSIAPSLASNVVAGPAAAWATPRSAASIVAAPSKKPLSMRDIQAAQAAAPGQSGAAQARATGTAWAAPTGPQPTPVSLSQPSIAAPAPVVSTSGGDEDLMFWDMDHRSQPSAALSAASTPSNTSGDFFGSGPSTPASAAKAAATKAAAPSSAKKPAAVPVVPAKAPAKAAPTVAKKTGPKDATFGGPKMSAEFEKWCKDQLQQITGSNDVTLAHFLMTLESPAQTREYIHEYLGNGGGVTEFATGFLRHKDFDSGAAKVSGKAASSTAPPPTGATSSSTGGGFGALIPSGSQPKAESAKKPAAAQASAKRKGAQKK